MDEQAEGAAAANAALASQGRAAPGGPSVQHESREGGVVRQQALHRSDERNVAMRVRRGRIGPMARQGQQPVPFPGRQVQRP